MRFQEWSRPYRNGLAVRLRPQNGGSKLDLLQKSNKLRSHGTPQFPNACGSSPWSTRALGQRPNKVWLIGYLGFGEASAWTAEVEAFKSGLRDLGYVDGKNVKIEFRWAERVDQTFELATQLVQMNVDVIFAPASTQVEPARRATTTILLIPLEIAHQSEMKSPTIPI